MNEALYKALKAWLETATRYPEPYTDAMMKDDIRDGYLDHYNVARFGLCCWVGGTGNREASGLLDRLLVADFNDYIYPFDRGYGDEYYLNKGRHHLNPRRVAWVKEKIAEWEAVYGEA